MIPQVLAGKLMKFLLPKVLDHLMQVFKLDQVLKYMEEDNPTDIKVKDLEKRIEKLES